MTDERARKIFTGATKLPQEERAAFLDEHCGDDAALRAEVEEFLAKDRGSTKVETEKHSRFEGHQVGETVGPFKIIRTLGEGGFGVVYLAEQTAPVKRRVALKVIKPGMDTKSVIARFEAERQALAMMDHAGIAKVFEAGATPEGRPYFVMEYVRGEPINTYCDRHRLDTRARLELFAKVCDAIQHAHQKGVIHRDLKPGNILVTIDARDEPQPKVIDFGIAKATSQQLTEHTIFTQQGQLIGTPEYMSPEQAEMSAVDVDTRSDVYSLGVILYELLSGRLPFDPETLRKAGFAEIQRIIREEDPPKPSTKLTTMAGEEGTRIAEARKTKLAELQSTLRRELEWIPLKALRKERTERYSSAEDLADDVRRYLVGEPLEAGPESASYRFKKLVRRNKGPFIAAALIALALIAGITGTTIFAVRAAENARLAEQRKTQAEMEADRAEAIVQFLSTMLASADPWMRQGMDTELVRTLLQEASVSIEEQFAGDPVIEAELRAVIGKVELSLGEYVSAREHLLRSLEISRNSMPDAVAEILVDLASANLMDHRYEEALPLYEEGVDAYTVMFGRGRKETLVALMNLGVCHGALGNLEVSEVCLIEARDGLTSVLGVGHKEVIAANLNLASLYVNSDRSVEAESIMRNQVDIAHEHLGSTHPATLHALRILGNTLDSLGQTEEAESCYRLALQGMQEVFTEDHPETAVLLSMLGGLLEDSGRYDEAKHYFNRYFAWCEEQYGEGDRRTLSALANLGTLIRKKDGIHRAEAYYRDALEKRLRHLGPDDEDTLNSYANMGYLMRKKSSFEESRLNYEIALEGRRKILGLDASKTLKTIGDMGYLYERWHEAEPEKGYDAKAAEYRALHEELTGATSAEPAEAAQP